MRRHFPDFLLVTGFAVVVAGLAMIHPVIAVLAAGGGLMGAGWLVGAADRKAASRREAERRPNAGR